MVCVALLGASSFSFLSLLMQALISFILKAPFSCWEPGLAVSHSFSPGHWWPSEVSFLFSNLLMRDHLGNYCIVCIFFFFFFFNFCPPQTVLPQAHTMLLFYSLSLSSICSQVLLIFSCILQAWTFRNICYESRERKDFLVIKTIIIMCQR